MATLRVSHRRPGRRLATLPVAALFAALTVGAAFEDPTCPHHEPSGGVAPRAMPATHATHAAHAAHPGHATHGDHAGHAGHADHAHDDEERPCTCAGFCIVAGIVAPPAAPPAPPAQAAPFTGAAPAPQPAAPPARRPADFLPLPNAPPPSRLS
jgi:hypothetical protein